MKHKDENGFVSIIVTSILMVLVSLIVLGFARIMQREQRQAIDRQLSTQAFYAAETAVNDVNEMLQNNPTELDTEKLDCDIPDGAPWNNGEIETGVEDVRYTCLRYDQAPGDLVFTNTITTANSEVFPIEPVSGNNVESVTLQWTGEEGSTTVHSSDGSCSGNLPTTFAPSTDSVPVMRLDLIYAPTSGFDKSEIAPNSASYYLYPSDSCGNASGNFSIAQGDDAGQVVYVSCDGNGCEYTINNLPNSDRYYARVRSLYNNVGTLRVTAEDGGSSFRFQNAQTVVDATGKSSDVLRRIEVRISNEPDYDRPEAVFESSNGLCKTLGVIPGATNPVREANCY